MKENFFSSPFFHQKSHLLLFYPFTREETKYPKSQQHIKQDFHNFCFQDIIHLKYFNITFRFTI